MVVDRFSRETSANLRFELLGSDISQTILRRAAASVFTAEDITGMPDEMRKQYLLRARKPIDGISTWPLYRIAPELRDKGRFSQVNLLDPGSAPRIEADIVFLRNVLIYFSNSDQQRAVATVASRIRSGGYLLTGHTERVEHGVAGLTRVASSIYRRE